MFNQGAIADISELFAQQFIPETLPILFCHMKTVMVEGASSITYLYKLVKRTGRAHVRLSPTLATTSHAAECALLSGVPRKVVDRGREVT